MKIGELGEIGIIKIFQDEFSSLPHILLGLKTPTGIYEDTGVIDLTDGKVLIVTTDLIGRKTHMPPEMTPRQMGRKSVIVNISDLAAMGAKPLGLVMSIGLPSDLGVEDLKEIAIGMNLAAEEYDTCIFGGDTNMTDDVILAGTAIGIINKEELLTRHSAKPDDVVAVTGYLGSSAAGLQILMRNFAVSTEIKKKLTKYTLEPKAQLKIAMELSKIKGITASGDITDGLAWELHKIAAASGCGIKIEENKLPILEETKKVSKEFDLNLIDLIMHIGEDFELILTVNPKKWEKVQEICQKNNIKISQIGQVTDKKNVVSMIDKNGNVINLKRKGYDQFSTRS
ncbi:MAG: thiamine-phosphate kinase [Candidatus Helarchaeota archaeon]|nr:thiamine-phosphate kinase [Candidatus Helarchaeota archaeon]